MYHSHLCQYLSRAPTIHLSINFARSKFLALRSRLQNQETGREEPPKPITQPPEPPLLLSFMLVLTFLSCWAFGVLSPCPPLCTNAMGPCLRPSPQGHSAGIVHCSDRPCRASTSALHPKTSTSYILNTKPVAPPPHTPWPHIIITIIITIIIAIILLLIR